jgi:outer membrane protein assembly factor BamD (BamD/ComL family)
VQEQSNGSTHLLARGIQVAAVAVLVVAVVLAALNFAVAIGQPKPPGGLTLADILRYVGPALLALVLGGGFAALLAALAELLLRPPQAAPGLADGLEQVNRSLALIVQEMRQSAHPSAPPAAAPSAPAMPAEFSSRQLDRMIELLEEMREVNMMSDEQRQQRLRQYMEHRKQASLQHLVRQIQQKQWNKASRGLGLLSEQFPGDADVARARQQLDEARAAAQAAAFRTVHGEVEDLMSISSWDQALSAVQRFLSDFPRDPEGEQLLARVTRERELFRESTVQRLFDETRHEIERRNWRRALTAAQRLIERFPEHHRTYHIRQQLKVIQENAEIEERQETEDRIQELIRGKRFKEAIDIGQDLMRRFPLSPQAEELEDLLPRLQELALQQELGSSRS